MYQLYMEDMKQIKKVAVLPNTLGPGSWEISYCLLDLWIRFNNVQIETRWTLFGGVGWGHWKTVHLILKWKWIWIPIHMHTPKPDSM